MLVFAGCKNDFEMEKPSEKAVSDLTAKVSYYSNYNGSGWQVYLYWFYDSADPAEYLVVCREDGSDEVHKIESDSLSAFNSHSLTDTWSNPGKYTYTVYTVGNGYSTSASKSVTVNCEYPSYNGGGSSSGSGSSSSGSLGNSTWKGPKGETLTFKNGKWDITMMGMSVMSGTYTEQNGGYQLYYMGYENVFLPANSNTLEMKGYGTFTRN